MKDDLTAEKTFIQFQKHARRRLIGAIVLVSFSIGTLWNVLDTTPPPIRYIHSEQIITVVDKATHREAITPTQELIHPSPPIISKLPNLTHTVPASDTVASVLQKGPEDTKYLSKKALPGAFVPSATKSRAKIDNLALKPVAAKKIPTAQIAVRKDPQRILEGLDIDTPPVNTISSKSVKKYWVRVFGSFDIERAQFAMSQIKNAGVRVHSKKVMTKKGPRAQLQAGPYASEEDAQQALIKIQNQAFNAILIAE